MSHFIIHSPTYGYGAGGVLESVSIADGRARTVSFVNDVAGQALRRDEADANTSQGDPHEVWYRFAGREIGHLGNNAAGASDYATSVGQREAVAGTGPFGNGDVSYGSDFATGDPGAITSFVQGAAGGSYTVRAGDTLASIAQALWGDASLWYKLAQANTLTADTQLSAGQVLTVPLGVQRSGYSAATFKPYDALDVLGDISPVNPAPVAQAQGGHKHGCGVFGQILLTVVAVAVVAILHAPVANLLSFGTTAAPTVAGVTAVASTAATIGGGVIAGAAGSIVSQGVGVATGLQDQFSWGAVALAGISGGVAGGLSNAGNLFSGAHGVAGVLQNVARGALGNALTQGVAVATGLQSKFDWTGVAVGGAVGGAVGAVHLGGVGGRVASGVVGALAGGAARSLIDGSDFGDNVLAALPDVIGSTIGELVAEGIASIGKPSPEAEAAAPASVGMRYLMQPEDEYGNPVGGNGAIMANSQDSPSPTSDIIVTARHWWERAWDKLENLFSGGVTAIENNSYVQGIASHVMAAVNRAGSYYAQAATGETQSYDMRPAVAALAQTYNRVMTAPLSRDYGAITPPMSLFDYSPPQPQVVKWHLTGSGIAAGTLEAASVVGAVKAGSLARAGLGAAESAAVRAPTGDFYSVAFETKLSPTSYPGVSRGAHFEEANGSLLQAMEADAAFASDMQSLGINLQRTPTGLAPRTSPSGWTWHHAEEPGVMQLVPRSQHQPGSVFQGALHPDGKGGYSIWGK